MKMKNEGQIAKDLILIAYNESNERLNLINIKKLKIEGDTLLGNEAALISHLQNNQPESFDPTILENQYTMSTSAPILSNVLKKKRPNIETNSLNIRHLKIQMNQTSKKSNLAFIELLRRYSLSAAVFSLTLLGCAFGIEAGRNPSKKQLFYALGLTLLVFISYLLGKSLKSTPIIAFLALLLPHPLLWIASIFRFRSLAKGTL